MTLLKFFSTWKSDSKSHRDVFDHAYIEGFSNGFEAGLRMSSEVDKMALNKAKETAIYETLGRLNARSN